MPTLPPDDTGKNLAMKKDQINEYMHATEPVATPMPVKPSPVMGVDKIHPKAKFGDKPGEKRIDVSSMTKPLGSLKKGTDHVDKTGTYKLHKGEAVIPAEKNPMNPYSKITESDKKPMKKSLKSIHTRKAKDGSYIHEHHHHAPHAGMEHMEEHTSPDMAAMKAHMDEHAPSIMAQPEPTPAGQTGAEAQGAALGMGQ